VKATSWPFWQSGGKLHNPNLMHPRSEGEDESEMIEMDERVVYIIVCDEEFRIGTVDDILDAKPNQDEQGCFPVPELMTVFADIIAVAQADGSDNVTIEIQIRDE
jgi:hypothetical protein